MNFFLVSFQVFVEYKYIGILFLWDNNSTFNKQVPTLNPTLEVLESIWAAGREPNQVTANTLVKAFVLSGDLEGAVRAVGDLGSRASLLPSPHALDMLIGACERQQRQDVIDSLYDALATVDAGLLRDLDDDCGPEAG